MVMKNLFLIQIVSLLLFVATIPVFSQGYEISVSLKTPSDTVLLGYYFAKSTYVSDTAILKNGKGVFRGDKKLEKGVYFLVSKKRIFFDHLIIGDQQKFSVVSDTVDFINQTKFTASPDNEVFFDYARHNINRGKQQQQLIEQYRNAASDAEKTEISAKLSSLTKESLAYVDQLIENNRHLYVSKIINSQIPMTVRVPEAPKDADGNAADPNFQYRWYRAHFFDNLNIFDPDMIRTSAYEDKLFEYISILPYHTDTICTEIDKIMTKAKANDVIFRNLLSTLYNHYVKLAQDIIVDNRGIAPENVWLHLVEKWYIPYATWSTEENTENLKKEVANRKPNLIGKHTPPIEMLTILPTDHFKAAALDTAIKFDLHAGRMVEDFRKDNALKSKFTVLLFWDMTCGHCKQAIQDLYNVWEEHKNNGLQVVTVQIYLTDRSDKGKWIDFVNEKNLFGTGWVNAWSPYSHTYRDLYNTAVVPVMYLLDENFDIILRGNLKGTIGAETIKEFCDNQFKNRK